MRTTLTLEDDVVAMLVRFRRARKATLKAAINQALRRGLVELTAPRPAAQLYQTRGVSLGRCLVPSLDDVAEALAIAEGDAHR